MKTNQELTSNEKDKFSVEVAIEDRRLRYRNTFII